MKFLRYCSFVDKFSIVFINLFNANIIFIIFIMIIINILKNFFIIFLLVF